MVRGNELGCIHGWKKDFWEPLRDGEQAAAPPSPAGARPPSGAEVAAAVMRVSPLDESDGDEASPRPPREDVVVGQQPIMRGFDRPRSEAVEAGNHGLPLSRDPGEAIRRAHEVFRDTAAQRLRRDGVQAPLGGGGAEVGKSAGAGASDGRIGAGEERANEATAAHGGAPLGDEPSRPMISDRPQSAQALSAGPLEGTEVSAVAPVRPSRWHLSPSQAVDEGEAAIRAESVQAESDEAEISGPTSQEPMSYEEGELRLWLSPNEPRTKRVLEQPASLSRHRWPPRQTGDPGLFPPRESDRDADQRCPVRSSSGEAPDAQDGQRSKSVDPRRREWQERWQTKSLLIARPQDVVSTDDSLDDDRPMTSHRVPIVASTRSGRDEREASSVDAVDGSNPTGDANIDVQKDRSGVTGTAMVAPSRKGTPTAQLGRLGDGREADGHPDPSWLDAYLRGVPRICMTCRDFRPAESGERGWCTNDWAFSHRTMVAAESRPCQTTIGSWWLPREAIWLEPVDVQGHGLPTPLVDTYLGEPKERVAQRRS